MPAAALSVYDWLQSTTDMLPGSSMVSLIFSRITDRIAGGVAKNSIRNSHQAKNLWSYEPLQALHISPEL